MDEELGLVYLPVETPSSDFYGGHRPGNNLFAESLVCVDLKTGQRKWHFQFVHHPIWNFDMPAAPILADINVDGRAIKAVAQLTKQGWVYVFDRVTGQPVWPIEERPVPQSDVPGEKTSPTQPHPTKPPPYARNYFKVPDDVIDFTPELRAQGLKNLERYKHSASVFTPPILGNANGLLGTRGSAARLRRTGLAGLRSRDCTSSMRRRPPIPCRGSLVAPPPGFSDIRYVSGVAGRPFAEVFGPGDCCAADSGRRTRDELPQAPPPAAAASQSKARRLLRLLAEGGGLTVQGLPILKPPYGILAAINLDRGEIAFQTPHGDTPDNIRNHPALKGLNIPKTGQAGTSAVGLLVTRTLVVMGDPAVTAPPGRPRGAMLRAYDKKGGQQVGEVWMPAIQSGSPMTYMVDGKQYIVVAVSGGNYTGEYIAFALPN